MPELPDLLYVQRRLSERLVGRIVGPARVKRPVVLRCLVEGTLARLTGERVTEIARVSHFLIFRCEALQLAINPMLAGRFQLASPTDTDDRALALALGFDEVELRYLDDKQMGKAYLMPKGPLASIPGLSAGGIDLLSPAFTVDELTERLRGRRDQVRVFLMDKRALDSLGNAYADEVLFAAGLHPKTWCRSLSPKDVARLHGAIVEVLTDAIAEVARRGRPTEEKVRDFLKVRNKRVCPRCGAKLRTAGVRGMDAFFCPRCQPATRAQLVDWTRTGK
jgi:formamidopyrimidine-DNA glycosylase